MPNTSTSEHSPNSAAGWPAEAFPPLASLAAAVGLVAVALASTFILAELLRIPPRTARQLQLTLPLVTLQVLDYIPVVLYVAFVLPRLARRPLEEIFGPFNARTVVPAFWGAVAMFFAVTVVGYLQALLTHETQHQLAVRLFQSTRPGLPLAIMASTAIVLGPVVEELVFRGFIYNALRRWAPFWPAAIISGLIFGATHGELSGILPLAAGGIVLAALYARTGSLWTSILTHGAFNALTLSFVLAGTRA